MNFYVGQEVVCIKEHSQGILIKGKHYFILDISKHCCGGFKVDVGIRDITMNGVPIGTVLKCANNKHIYIEDGIWWLDPDRFAPIEQIPESHELEVKKLIEESIPVNI